VVLVSSWSFLQFFRQNLCSRLGNQPGKRRISAKKKASGALLQQAFRKLATVKEPQISIGYLAQLF